MANLLGDESNENLEAEFHVIFLFKDFGLLVHFEEFWS